MHMAMACGRGKVVFPYEAFNYPVLIQEAEEGDNQVTKTVGRKGWKGRKGTLRDINVSKALDLRDFEHLTRRQLFCLSCATSAFLVDGVDYSANRVRDGDTMAKRSPKVACVIRSLSPSRFSSSSHSKPMLQLRPPCDVCRSPVPSVYSINYKRKRKGVKKRICRKVS